jgi:hypothetical protein
MSLSSRPKQPLQTLPPGERYEWPVARELERNLPVDGSVNGTGAHEQPNRSRLVDARDRLKDMLELANILLRDSAKGQDGAHR